MTDSIAVLEVGGTHVTAAWVDRASETVTAVHRRGLAADGSAEELLAGLAEAAATLDAPAGTRWGMAMPGPFDYQRGIAHYAGVGKFEGLTGVDVRAALDSRLQPASIHFVNDASAFLIGEWLVGTALGADRCAAVTLGTGVGSAFLDRGQVVESGPDVPPDGEVHLLEHDGRPLEDWVSRRAIRRSFADRTGRPDDTDVKEIAALARAGNEAALVAFNGAFSILGEVLAPWLERFGVAQLVIGGSIAGAWDLIEAPLVNGLRARSDYRFSIGLAADPERSPLLGAAHIA
ncbi:MAG TPA: ROK family protein [Jatrophihabitans sp.]|nr:ROK family protein [Jatrophihabitans sp.]